MNSSTRSTIYPNGANTGTDHDIQIRSKGVGTLQLNNDNAGTGDVSICTNLIYADASADTVGIKTTILTSALDIAHNAVSSTSLKQHL